MRALSSKQVIALAYVAQRGEHAPTGVGYRPWQFSTAEYRRILDGLAKRGLVEAHKSGVMSITLRVGATQKFTPSYSITAAGREALINLKEGSAK